MRQPDTREKYRLENSISLVLIAGVVLSVLLEISGNADPALLELQLQPIFQPYL